MASKDYGYEDSRFVNEVSDNFHCSICLNVFKEPKMCKNNQHLFCSSCITRHLASVSRCPECNDELTVETLSQAPRVLLNCLYELRIKCDYFSRGCREFIQLGNLLSHVRDCGFAPVTCSNQDCSVEINKRDRIHHETEACHFRKVQCHECGEIRKEIEKLKMNQAKLNNNLAELKAELKANTAELRSGALELKADMAELKGNVTDLKANVVELKENQSALNASVVEIKLQLPSLKDDMVNEMRGIMRDVLTKMNIMQTIHPPLRTESGTTTDVIIAGGWGKVRLSSVELYSWANRTWTRLPPMKKTRSSASSFVYNNQVVVAGGFAGSFFTAKMEGIKIDHEPLQWTQFPAELPARLWSHKTVLLRNVSDRLIVVGGHYVGKNQSSNGIYEVILVHPYSSKMLCLMPQPRADHGVEIINDKIYILGGATAIGSEKYVLDSVIVYDSVNNKCENMPPLPYPVSEISTVSWQNKVIVLGGMHKNGKSLNDVIMYDVETGESKRLPSMIYRRYGCSAVVTAGSIVVMGGKNEQGTLNTAECFTFSGNTWQELPPMLECRQFATAVVKPC